MEDTFKAGHLAMLERVAAGAPLPQLLEDIVRFIERQSQGMVCSILLLDPEERCIRHGAAPSLPPEFVRALNGARIGPHAGSCGAAAYGGEEIIIPDIATHPNWEDYRHLALPHGLRACWSTPIFSPDKEVLGTFAMYYRENRGPNDQERQWVAVATHLASMAILRERGEQQLRSSEQRARQLARLYAVSNGVNETIARVRDPQPLYDFACRIAVEQGLARMAWVGLCVKAHEQVLPVARYGVESKVLDSIAFHLKDERVMQGPIGRAILTGEPALSNDIASDPHVYFKEAAQQSGVQSCAVFPLKVGGRVMGVFTLGAERTHYFGSDEIQVLTTLAADISLAVESIVNERERRRMEDSMRASEALRAFIYSSVEDVIFYLSIEGPDRFRLLSANPAFLKATGLKESDVVGKLVSEVIPDPSLAVVLQKYQEAISRREKVSWDEVTAYPTGVKHGHVTISPVLDAEGRCTHLIGTVHDITALKQEQEKRLALETHLHQAQRLQSLGTMAGGIAHDFNNILSALSINVDTALLDTPAEAPLRPYLLDIQKTIRRATGLVRQILTFGRSEPPQRAMVDLRETIDDALRLMRATLPPNVLIVTHFDPQTPVLAADAMQIQQLVMNLCLNAAYALGARGGTIDILVESWEQTAESAKESLELKEGRYVRLSFRDDGCGMDAETLKRAFDPFFTTKPPGIGSGLGLSVVEGIVKGHNGVIHVESNVGLGTVFRVYLPVAVIETAAPAPSGPVDGNAARVLYVDDEEALAFLVPRALRRMGYQVTAYADSLAALEDFRARPEAFDIVLTDIAMPGLSGRDFIKEVRRVRPEIPIVMLSGFIQPEDREIAERFRVNRLLYKPSTIAELSQTLLQELGVLTAERPQ